MSVLRSSWVIALLALVGILAFESSAFAQCSMCRAALSASQNAEFIRNMNIGVLVLLVPPVTIFCSIFIVLRRYNGDGESSTNSERDQHQE